MNDELVWAIKNGDLDKVKEIIEEQGVNVNTSIEGRQPCHFAADYGQLEVLQYLVKRGGDVEGKDKHGISVILAAIWEGHTPCVRFLLEQGSSKSGFAPDGTPYLNATDEEEIKTLLK